jgi:hypothetical protein
MIPSAVVRVKSVAATGHVWVLPFKSTVRPFVIGVFPDKGSFGQVLLEKFFDGRQKTLRGFSR